MNLMKSVPKYAYQQVVRDKIRPLKKAGLAVYYGGGKTYLSLQWLADRVEQGEHMLPCLVECPSNLVAQWGDQIALHSNFTSSLITGSIRQRQEAINQQADIYVVGYDALNSQLRNRLNQLAVRINTIIADESIKLKSAKTTRFKLNQYLYRGIPNRMILTGRPITEGIEDLWAQMFFLDDGVRLGSSWFKFMHENFENDPYVPFKKNMKKGAEQRIADRLMDIIAYVPKEAVASQLPPHIFVPVRFDMPDEVRKAYRELMKTFRLDLEDGRRVVDTQWAIVKASKLLEMCHGFLYADDDPMRDNVVHFKSPKLEWLDDSIEEILVTGPTIIWAHHIQSVDDITAVLRGRKIPHLSYRGGDEKPVKAFIEGIADVLVLSITAANAGLNLQRARNAIFFSHAPSGNMYDNAIHRNYRSGSEIHENVMVYQLIMNHSVDSVLFDALQAKLDLGDQFLKYFLEPQ